MLADTHRQDFIQVQIWFSRDAFPLIVYQLRNLCKVSLFESWVGEDRDDGYIFLELSNFSNELLSNFNAQWGNFGNDLIIA